jgi:DNA-binding beta-propeller fold protein YncE
VLLAGILAVRPVEASAQFESPTGVAVDRQGNVYVTDSGDGRILKVSPNGMVIRARQESGTDFEIGNPVGIAVDRSGYTYVTDFDNATVLKYGPRGVLADQWARNGDGEFNSPQGIALGNRGNVFVANTGNKSIEKLTPDGYVLNSWVVQDQAGSLSAPQWIAVGADGAIYTTVDTGKTCGWCPTSFAIQKRGSDGSLTAVWPMDERVSGIAVGGRGNVFVVSPNSGEIVKLGPGGQQLERFTGDSSGAAGFSQPTGIALDRQGNIYVADTGNNRVVKLSPTGHRLATWQ